MSKLILRDYQKEAVDAAIWGEKKFTNNSLIVLPTAAGKSVVISEIANRLNKEILILQPSKEILEQNMRKMQMYVPPFEVGVYSASFGRKDIAKYNFATIQSIYKKPEIFKNISIVIVDEAHLVNPRNTGGMFNKFLEGIGNPTTIGLTASPFRNVTGYANVGGVLTSATTLKLINRMNPRMWNRILYKINGQDLLDRGYLSPLRYISRTNVPHRDIPLNKSCTDFNLTEYEKLLGPFEEQIVHSITRAKAYHKSILVFCSSVSQANRLSSIVTQAASVSGDTPARERDRLLKEFSEGTIQVMFNVGVLTTGYDYPELGCIYLLRPTRSLGLYYQMLGRGVRIAPNKKECVVVDYSGTYEVFGDIYSIKLEKEGNLWQLYANNKSMHGEALYSYAVR